MVLELIYGIVLICKEEQKDFNKNYYINGHLVCSPGTEKRNGVLRAAGMGEGGVIVLIINAFIGYLKFKGSFI